MKYRFTLTSVIEADNLAAARQEAITKFVQAADAIVEHNLENSDLWPRDEGVQFEEEVTEVTFRGERCQ